MRSRSLRPITPFLIFGLAAVNLPAQQQPFTWNEVRERFRQNNPSLLAGALTIEENRANEVTAGLRPNPDFGFTADQFHIFNPNPLRPFQKRSSPPPSSSCSSAGISGNCAWPARG